MSLHSSVAPIMFASRNYFGFMLIMQIARSCTAVCVDLVNFLQIFAKDYRVKVVISVYDDLNV